MKLDPPYGHAERDSALYAVDTDCAPAVRAWCLAHGDHPQLRIVLAGYSGEHEALAAAGWTAHRWQARGGYGAQGAGRGRANAVREVLWFSPHCLHDPARESMQLSLLGAA